MSKPLALMDVDGVLNLFGIKLSDVETAPNIWPVPKMGFDVHAGVFQFYQIFWLDKMGLVRDLPVLDLGERPLDASDKVSWKASRLANLLPANSTGLWLDDEVTGAEHGQGLPIGIAPVRTNPKVGLTMTKLRSLGL